MARQRPVSVGVETVELVIPSTPEMIVKVDRIVEALISKLGFDGKVRDDVEIAVNEVVNNAILHGNKCDALKKVIITFVCEPSRFSIRVKDYGEGFDPNTVPDPLAPDNLLKENGRGLLILRMLMDEVSFRVIPGQGTEVTIVKYASHQS